MMKTHSPNHHNDAKGFTLLELSIVLIIISLIAGGILGGRAIVRGMELKKIGLEANEYKAAVSAFHQRFNALPGDMENATQYWGAEDADHATCIALTTASTTEATCNGNGDGKIAPTDDADPFFEGTETYEMFRAWQHLHNAELTDFKPTGVQGSGGSRHVDVNVNAPPGPLEKTAGWSLLSIEEVNCMAAGTCTECIHSNMSQCPIAASGKFIFPQSITTLSTSAGRERGLKYGLSLIYGNELDILEDYDATNDLNSAPTLTPKDAEYVDLKFDDGIANTGNIYGVGVTSNEGPSGNVRCMSGDGNIGAHIYTNSKPLASCALAFVDIF